MYALPLLLHKRATDKTAKEKVGAGRWMRTRLKSSLNSRSSSNCADTRGISCQSVGAKEEGWRHGGMEEEREKEKEKERKAKRLEATAPRRGEEREGKRSTVSGNANVGARAG
jgi:hypothetical protein